MKFVRESLRRDGEAFVRFAPRLSIHERFLQRAANWAIAVVGALFALGLMGFQGVATSMLATGGDAGLTSSTDVTTALEIRSAPLLAVQLAEQRT